VINTSGAVARNADREPDAVALIGGGRRLTNAALHARVGELAAGLAERGVGPGDVVAVLSENRVEYVELVLAVNRLGAIYLPLNYRLAPPEWRYILEHAGAGLVVAEPALCERMLTDAPDCERLEFGDELEAVAAAHAGEQRPDADVGLDDTQRLMYTSGTTSRPKGVRITYGNAIFKTLGLSVEFDVTGADRVLVAGPLYHVGGMDLPGTGILAHGGSMVILRRFEPGLVLDAIEAERPTCVWLAPAMVRGLMERDDLPERDLASLRFMINGGEKMPLPLMRRLLDGLPNCRVADAYGLTETVGGDTYVDRLHVLDKLGSVGKPVLHLECQVVLEDGARAGPGETGEICLRGPKVFGGYWRDDRATAEAICDGWFHTGDVGRLDADGYLWIVDRMGDLIVSGGENIASSEVERVLYEHDAILEAAVVATPDERWGEVPTAYVVAADGVTLEADALIAHCSERLARFKVPQAVEFVEALPRNASGKVLKRELRDRAERLGDRRPA